MCTYCPYLKNSFKCWGTRSLNQRRWNAERRMCKQWVRVNYVFLWFGFAGKYYSSIGRRWLNSWRSQKTLLLFCTSHQSCYFSSPPTACSTHLEDVSHRSLLFFTTKSQRYYILMHWTFFKLLNLEYFGCESLPTLSQRQRVGKRMR